MGAERIPALDGMIFLVHPDYLYETDAEAVERRQQALVQKRMDKKLAKNSL